MKTYNITLFFMLCIFSVCNLVTSELKEHHLEDLCDGWNTTKLSLKYIRSGILKASSSKQPIDCQVELSPDHGSSVVLSISKYRLNGDDVLTITDSDNVVISLQGKHNFADEEKSFTSNGPMLIRFVSNDTYFYFTYSRFQFTFTQVHDGPCSDEFQCRNLNCIPKDLTCDYHNNCGDNSDEAFDLCYTVPTVPYDIRDHYNHTFEPITIETHTTLILPLIIIGGILLILIIVIPLTIYGVKKMKKTAKPQPFVQGTDPPQNPTAPTLQAPTVPVSQLPMVLVMQNPTAPAPTPVAPSVFSRLRQSLRRSKPASQAPTRADQTEMESYQVPSMYPQIPDASNEAGVENPEFKIEE